MSDTLTVLCPRCERERYTPYTTTKDLNKLREVTKNALLAAAPFPALSRLDNKTYICSSCGTDEAMRDFAGAPPIPPSEWPVKGE